MDPAAGNGAPSTPVEHTSPRRIIRRQSRRFEDLHRHVSNQTEILTGHLGVFSGTVDERFTELWAKIGAHDAELIELRARLFDEAETLAEMTIGLERAGARVERRLAEVEALVASAGEILGRVEQLASSLAEVAQPRRPTHLGELDEETAHYLNWATSYAGLSGEAGCWINDPYYLEFVEGGVRVRLVNERVVEIPYAYAVAALLPEGACVVDVGCAESPLAISLASLGLRTIAVDPRGYPFAHPNLEVVAGAIEDWRGPDEEVAAVFCVSTLEHLGVGAYGQSTTRPDLDREVMDLFAKWLAPDGVLVLTVPVGKRSHTDFERTYDRAQLDELTAGWTTRDVRFYRRLDDLTWLRADADDVFAGTRLAHGVALLTLSVTQ